MSKHYITKYSSKQLKAVKAQRDANKRRQNPGLGPTAVVSDMDDIANHTARQQEIANQLEQYGDCLFA